MKSTSSVFSLTILIFLFLFTALSALPVASNLTLNKRSPIDLSYWLLQVPQKNGVYASNGKLKYWVYPPNLQTTNSVSSPKSGYQVFSKSSTDLTLTNSIKDEVGAAGGSTSRTELREYVKGQANTQALWNVKSGTHIMAGSITINQCASGCSSNNLNGGAMVLGQVKGSGSEIISIRYFTDYDTKIQNGKPYLRRLQLVYTSGDKIIAVPLDEKFELKQRFNFEFKFSNGGKFTFKFNDKTFTLPFSSSNAHFKIGAYSQNSSGAKCSKTVNQVTIHSLSVSHS